jgi:uncharacterized membrane protein
MINNNNNKNNKEEQTENLESIISIILIAGIILSLTLVSIGMILYYTHRGGITSPHFTTKWQMSGKNFFIYVGNLISEITTPSSFNAINIMALGLVLLIITPFVRVVVSVIFFGVCRNFKYVLITSFVLILLTSSLIIH